MADRSFLEWPFFEESHRTLAAELETAAAPLAEVPHGNIDETCRALARWMGEAGWLRHAVGDRLDVRTLCLIARCA
jgi:acyl-CoA dehydrogenase